MNLMMNADLHEQRIVESAEGIADAPDEPERNRRRETVETLAGIWAGRVMGKVDAILKERCS